MRLSSAIILSVFCAYSFAIGNKTELSREGESLPRKILPENKNSLQDYPDFVQAISSKAKKVYKNQSGSWEAEFDYGIIMVYIPSGKYQSGSDNESSDRRPVPEVIYLDGYWIGKYEVTFDQFDHFCEEEGIAKPDDESWGRESRPAINVSYLDAVAYCQWFSRRISCNFNLPTESQWEKAAQGTENRAYPWGDSLSLGNKANFADSSTNFEWRDSTVNDQSKYTAPVGSYPEGSSPYGVMDMAGNVYEWCLDWYSTSRSSSSTKNSRGIKKGTYRVLRGGSWNTSSKCLRTTFRSAAKPSSRNFHIGFRLCIE